MNKYIFNDSVCLFHCNGSPSHALFMSGNNTLRACESLGTKSAFYFHLCTYTVATHPYLRARGIIIDPPVIAADKIDCLVITVSSRESCLAKQGHQSHLAATKATNTRPQASTSLFQLHILFSETNRFSMLLPPPMK